MNAVSKEDRDSWIDAIRRATPTSSQPLNRKDYPKSNEPRIENGTANGIPHPTQTERQNTAFNAAVAIATNTDADEEQREVDEVS